MPGADPVSKLRLPTEEDTQRYQPLFHGAQSPYVYTQSHIQQYHLGVWGAAGGSTPTNENL